MYGDQILLSKYNFLPILQYSIHISNIPLKIFSRLDLVEEVLHLQKIFGPRRFGDTTSYRLFL